MFHVRVYVVSVVLEEYKGCDDVGFWGESMRIQEREGEIERLEVGGVF